MKKIWGGGSGECDPRIEAIVKLKSRGSDWVGSNVKTGFPMSKYDIRPEFECQNRIWNVKIRYTAPVRMSK